MPSERIGNVIAKHHRIILVVIIVLTLIFGAAASNVKFETEEDSFDPKSDTSIALTNINTEFGSESHTVQVIAIAENGGVLSQQYLMDILRFQWEMENQSVISSTLSSDNSAVTGPPDIVYGINRLMEGVGDIDEVLDNANASVDDTAFLMLEDMAGSIDNQMEALSAIMQSAPEDVKSAALDIFSLVPTLMVLGSQSEEQDAGDGFENFPMEDLLLIITSVASPGVKGNVSDILATQLDLVDLMAETGGGEPSTNPLSSLEPILLNSSIPRETKQQAISSTMDLLATSSVGLAEPMQNMAYLAATAGEVLEKAIAEDANAANLSTAFQAYALENATVYGGIEAVTWHSLGTSVGNLLYAINNLSYITSVHGDVGAAMNNTILALNHTLQNTTATLSISPRFPELNVTLAAYHQYLTLVKMQLPEDASNLSLVAMRSEPIVMHAMIAAGTLADAGEAFMDAYFASQGYIASQDTIGNITNATIMFDVCTGALESWGGRTYLTSVFQRMLQNLHDIYTSDAEQYVVDASTRLFFPNEGEPTGGGEDGAEMMEAFKHALKGYRDMQWSGITSFSDTGDMMLLSQFSLMALSMDAPADEENNVTIPATGRQVQMDWLSNVTDEDIRNLLTTASVYDNRDLREKGNRTSELMFASAHTAARVGSVLGNTSSRIHGLEDYGWRNATVITAYALFFKEMGQEINSTSSMLVTTGVILMRLPDTGDLIPSAMSGLALMLSSDLTPGTWKANAGLIIISQDTTASRAKRMAAQQMITDMSHEFQGDVVLRPMAMMVFMEKINDTAQSSLLTLFPLAILFIFVVLLIIYKNFLDTVLSLLALVMAILWIFGIAVLLGYTFNVVAVAVPVLLVGLGIDYAIHLIMRYREERKKDDDISRSAVISIATVGGAITLTTATTMIGFLSNTTSSIAPIRDFGLLTALGILCALVVMITFVPSVKIMLDSRKARRLTAEEEQNGKENQGVGKKRESGERSEGEKNEKYDKPMKNGERALSAFLGSSAYAAEKHPVKVLVVVALITCAFAYGALQLETEFDIMDFLPENIEESKTIEYLVENFNFSDDYVYIYIKGDMTDPSLLEEVHAVTLEIRGLKGVAADEPLTPSTILRDMGRLLPTDVQYNQNISTVINQQDTSGDGIPNEELREVYDTIRQNDTAWKSLGFVLHYNPTEDSYNSSVIRIKVDLRNVDVNELANSLRETSAPLLSLEGVDDVKVTGGSILGQETMDEINANQIRSLFFTIILCIVILMIIMGWLDKSPLLGAITVVPICIVIVWMWGSMFLFGFKLNVMTNMIAALSVGLGLTYAVHVTHRFKEELDRTGNPDIACREAVTRTGSAVTGAAVTTMGGFFILSFSVLTPMRVFGQITALAVLYGYISSVFILPTLLVVWARHRKKKGDNEETKGGEVKGDKGELPEGSNEADVE